MRASQDSLDQRELLVTQVLKEIQDVGAIKDRGVFLETLDHQGKRGRSDILDPTA